MKITGVESIYAIPAEGPDSPATTFIELDNSDVVVLDNSAVNYINLSWDPKTSQHVAEVDVMERR